MRSRTQVLVLNASYEPLSVVSAPRAIALLGDGKAIMVIEVPPAACPPHPFPRQEPTQGNRTGSFVTEHGTQNGTWKSCGGSVIDIPSVVSLRRFITVPAPPRTSLLTALRVPVGVRCSYVLQCAQSTALSVTLKDAAPRRFGPRSRR